MTTEHEGWVTATLHPGREAPDWLRRSVDQVRQRYRSRVKRWHVCAILRRTGSPGTMQEVGGWTSVHSTRANLAEVLRTGRVGFAPLADVDWVCLVDPDWQVIEWHRRPLPGDRRQAEGGASS